MSNISTSASATIVALLGTVSTTASTAVKAVNQVAMSLDMLDAYVSKAKADQATSYKINAKDNLRRIIHEAGEIRAIRESALEQRMSANPRTKQLFLEAVAEYEAMFPELAMVTQP